MTGPRESSLGEPEEIGSFVTRGLGDSTYLVASGDEAVVVDPQRDAGRFMAAADAAGQRIVAVVETHVHNDYVSGALEIQAATGARIVAPAAGRYAFPHRPVEDGDTVDVGDLRLTALSTPGHTPEHLSWTVSRRDGEPYAVLTGGSLLAGSAGRTDLLGSDRTEELTTAQFHSLRRLAAFSNEVRVLPTHGAGSFCMAGPAASDRTSTIGAERAANPLLAFSDEVGFRQAMLRDLGPYPTYYAEMAPINRAGPVVLGGVPAPRRLEIGESSARSRSGAWVVDLRDRRAFAEAHLAGSLGIELSDSFAGYVGWLVPYGAPLILVVPPGARGADEEAARAAALQLHRIGWDAIEGWSPADPDAWRAAGSSLESYEVLAADDVADELGSGGSPTIVDVRGAAEWREGTLDGSVLRSLSDLARGVGDLPRDRALTVLCASGERASVASGWLQRAGFDVRLVAQGGAPAVLRRLGLTRA